MHAGGSSEPWTEGARGSAHAKHGGVATGGKLKRFKRIALRCEKTEKHYRSHVSFAAGLILIKPAHTT